jgi:hypothetical protein
MGPTFFPETSVNTSLDCLTLDNGTDKLDNRALQGSYAANSGNSLRTFRDDGSHFQGSRFLTLRLDSLPFVLDS